MALMMGCIGCERSLVERKSDAAIAVNVPDATASVDVEGPDISAPPKRDAASDGMDAGIDQPVVVTCGAGQHPCGGGLGCVDVSNCCADSDCAAGPANTAGRCNTITRACSYACATGFKTCTTGGPCVASTSCCVTADCTTGGTNTVSACNTTTNTCSYTCSTGFKACAAGGACLANSACCTDADCTGGGANAVGTCNTTTHACSYACATGFKACTTGGACVASSGCCVNADCPAGTGNMAGVCNAATGVCSSACAAGFQSCAGSCISTLTCCLSACPTAAGGTAVCAGAACDIACAAANYACVSTPKTCHARTLTFESGTVEGFSITPDSPSNAMVVNSTVRAHTGTHSLAFPISLPGPTATAASPHRRTGAIMSLCSVGNTNLTGAKVSVWVYIDGPALAAGSDASMFLWAQVGFYPPGAVATNPRIATWFQVTTTVSNPTGFPSAADASASIQLELYENSGFTVPWVGTVYFDDLTIGP